MNAVFANIINSLSGCIFSMFFLQNKKILFSCYYLPWKFEMLHILFDFMFAMKKPQC